MLQSTAAKAITPVACLISHMLAVVVHLVRRRDTCTDGAQGLWVPVAAAASQNMLSMLYVAHHVPFLTFQPRNHCKLSRMPGTLCTSVLVWPCTSSAFLAYQRMSSHRIAVCAVLNVFVGYDGFEHACTPRAVRTAVIIMVLVANSKGIVHGAWLLSHAVNML